MKRFKNILLIADDVCWHDTALQRAVSLAEHNQADLTVICALNFSCNTCLNGDSTYDRIKNAIIDTRHDEIKTITAQGSSAVNIKSKVLGGAIFPEIIHEVLRNGYDLVIKCAEKTSSLHDRIFGSTDMHLLRKCPSPVWIMKSNEKEKYQRIFAAVDFEEDTGNNNLSGLNQQILEMASSLALSEFSELHIVHAWTVWGESLLNAPRFSWAEKNEVSDWVEKQRMADEIKMNALMTNLSEMLKQDTMGYLKPQVHIIKGEAHKVIPNLAREKEADLVVMGTVARTGIPGLIMGNTAESILNRIECSVLAIKPPGFVTPVTLAR